MQSKLRIHREDAAVTESTATFEVATAFGVMRLGVQVWTEAEWHGLAARDRPAGAYRFDNGVRALLAPARP